MAWVQFHAATQNPPSLVTIIPFEGPINAYHYSMRCGGALHLGLLQWILDVAISSKEARVNPSVAKAIKPMRKGKGFLQWASRIPWRRGQTPLSMAPKYEDAAFQLYFENNDYNDFWRQPGFGMDEYFDSFPQMPILWVVGWYDWYPRAIIDGYQKMVKMGRKNQHLLVGPWLHNSFNASIGDVNFGTKGGSIRSYDDFLQLELQWFNRWLKDDASAQIGKPVKVFAMGGGDGKKGDNGRLNHGGEWYYDDIWPPENIQPTNFYLHADGTLSQRKPSQQHSSTTYTYDPRNTVSSNGRCIISYGPFKESGFSGMGPRDQIELETLPGHGIPTMPIASRPDVLVFQTSPLAEDIRIAGNIKAILQVSSDAPDTDFYVKLVDVYPSSSDYPAGYGLPVSEGIIRARYRDSRQSPTLMEPGKIYQIEIVLEPAANLFKANHRIRLDICSSNFPNFDINRNTGNPSDRRWRLADNTIYHEATNASYIVLPVFPIITAHR
jgi:putative CocE/NonD family hydrolase